MKKMIENLIAKQKTCMIASVDGDSYPVVKVVNAPRKRDGLKTMYFTTPSSSLSVQLYSNNPNASVYFVDEGRFQTALFFGIMSVETDQEIREYMKEGENAKIFSRGIDDKDYCVLRFEATHIRFFSNLETKDIIL